MKKIIYKLFRSMGYEIHKISKQRSKDMDFDLYEDFYPLDSIANRRFYNIGAGGFFHPYWTNIDYDSDWYSSNKDKTMEGIQYDLFSLAPLPIDNDSAEVVYSSHTVEHIDNQAAHNLFSEAYRILKPNGFFRIVTPNIDLEYRAYKENDRHYFYWISTYSIKDNYERIFLKIPLSEASIEQIFLHHFASSASTLHSDGIAQPIDDEELNSLFSELGYEQALDYCISKCPVEIQKKYPGNHMNWWNFKKISSMLTAVGFSKIYLSGYGQSFSPLLRNTTSFDNTHPKISLYVEAVR